MGAATALTKNSLLALQDVQDMQLGFRKLQLLTCQSVSLSACALVSALCSEPLLLFSFVNSIAWYTIWICLDQTLFNEAQSPRMV